ncbi:MAG: FAD-dependent oxidoreductase [Planctomycetota bacterium]|nr:FAD-dependent oxidoreductase [Planctomycetota bacterium]
MTGSDRGRAVVVGGGVGGLSAAILLADGGYDTVLVEQHRILGGYQQSFERGGVRFEVGHHYLGGCRPGEPFRRYLQILGIDRELEFLPARDEAAFRVVLSDGSRLDVPRGMDGLADVLKRLSPADSDGIEALLAKVCRCVEASPWHGMKRREPDRELHEAMAEVSVREAVYASVSAPQARELLESFCFSTTMPPPQCPFLIYAHILHLLAGSVSRIRGGGRGLVSAMERRLRGLGGRILTGVSAERLIAADRIARAIELSNGTSLDLDVLVFACHPAEAVRVCGRENFSPGFLENFDAMEQGRGSFKVYIETSRPVESLGADHCLVLSRDGRLAPGIYVASPSAADPSAAAGRSRADRSAAAPDATDGNVAAPLDACPAGPDTRGAAAAGWSDAASGAPGCGAGRSGSVIPGGDFRTDGSHTVEIVSWHDFDEVAPWADSTFGRRPREYIEFKERRARELIALAETRFPGISGSARRVWTSSALTNLHYTRSARGAAMGVSHSIRFQGRNAMRPRNRLRNVFFAGQSVGLPGVAGTVITSFALCHGLLDGADLLGRLLER